MYSSSPTCCSNSKAGLALDDRKRPSNRATHALLKSKFDKVKAVREAASDALVMLTDLLARHWDRMLAG